MSTQQETFLCYKYYHTIETKSSMHECIGINHGQSLLRSLFRSSWINEEVQVSEETARKVEVLIRKQDGLWNCLVCDFKSSKNCHLKEHMKTLCFKHIEGLQYPCNYCGKVLSTRKAARRHIFN